MKTKIQIKSILGKVLFEYETKRNSEDFKQIQATYEAHKAYVNFLKK